MVDRAKKFTVYISPKIVELNFEFFNNPNGEAF